MPRLLPAVVVALLATSTGCDGAVSSLQPIDVGTTTRVTSAGRLDGMVTRLDGTPAVRLPVAGEIHGVAVITSSTDETGAFSMRVTNGVTDTTMADTVLTIFVTGRTTVGRVADRLVMRVPVQVRMSRDLATPVITKAELRAGY